MIKVTTIQAIRAIGALLILLSGDAFAVTYATQPALNAEIFSRKSGDSTETARATKAEGTLNKAIAAETARAKAAESPVLIPGDSYQGGIVFWVDQTGQHGLIAAKADQSTGVQWYNGTYFQTHATADGIYAGAKNTEIIIATQTAVQTTGGLVFEILCRQSPVPSDCSAGPNPGTFTGDYAALIAANYSVQDDGITACTGATNETCYGDWYLPSIVELNLLRTQKLVVGGFANSFYWSSTEYDSDGAWGQYFGNGAQGYLNKYNPKFRVRAVRTF